MQEFYHKRLLIEPNQRVGNALYQNGSQMSEKGHKSVEMKADVEVEYCLRQGAFVSHCDESELVLTCDEVGEVFADIAKMFPYMGEAEKNTPWKAQDAVDKLLWEIQNLLEEKVNQEA